MTMTLVWSANFVIGKVALREFPVLTLTQLRVTLSAVILWPFFLLRSTGEQQRNFRQEWKTLAWMSLFGVAFNQVFFIAGLKNTSVAHSSIIISLTPVFVLLIARMHGLEPLTLAKIVGLGISMAGVTMLTVARPALSGAPGPTLLGDLYAALGSMAFAYFAVIGKGMTARFDAVSLNTMAYTFGAVMLLPASAAELWHGSASGASGKAWLSLLYMAAGASVLGYVIFYWALRRIAATRVTAFSYLQPVLVTLMGVIFLRERLTFMEMAAAATILTGVYLTEREQRT